MSSIFKLPLWGGTNPGPGPRAQVPHLPLPLGDGDPIPNLGVSRGFGVWKSQGVHRCVGAWGVSPLWGKTSDFWQMEGALKLPEEVGTVGIYGILGEWL